MIIFTITAPGSKSAGYGRYWVSIVWGPVITAAFTFWGAAVTPAFTFKGEDFTGAFTFWVIVFSLFIINYNLIKVNSIR
jgi:hypothetical protein